MKKLQEGTDMTEAEWLAATDPRRMFDWIRQSGKADRFRLGMLFGACCDRIPRSAAEAPGEARPGARWADDDDDQIALTDAEFYLYGAVLEAMRSIPREESNQAALTGVIRDIFGNPFRPILIDAAWLTWNNDTVVKLARTIYDDRRFDLMPILGDALEDAMCDNADILEHCRGPGPHVRGCWVVDLILGKS